MRRKDDKKHKAICDAAIKLITTKGFADTSMSKIAKAAGVSPATIYIYFENKEDLLNQLYLMAKREKSVEMLKGVDESMPLKEAFQKVWNNFFNYAVRNPVNFAFSEQFFNSPLVNRISKDEGMSYYEMISRMITDGKKQKVLKNMPDELFTAFTFSPLMGLIKQHLAGEIKLDQKLLDETFEIAWDAVTN